MVSYLIEGFLLGLSVSPLCLAYCTLILAPFVTSEEKLKIKGTFRLLVLFLVGRLVGYVVIGFLTGTAGSALFKNSKSMFPAVITIVTGMILFFYGLLKNFPGLKLCSYFGNKSSSVIFMPILGLLTGLNICPPFVAAIIGASTMGAIPGAVFYFIAFFIGTLILFPLMVIWGFFTRWESARQIARVCLIIGGVWLLGKGIIGIISYV
jgi:sulfite exporter TauE/SafE